MTNGRLKGLYITVFATTLFIAAFHTLYMLGKSNFELAWIGAVISLIPASGLFMWLMIANVVRTSPNLTGILTATYTGAAISSFAWATAGPDALNPGLAFSYAAGPGAAGFTIYVFWYSRFGRGENSILKIGQSLPEFSLEDIDGNEVVSRSFRGKPALFLFYRGNWCPLCMAQIKEVAERYRELTENGVEVILVSPQSHDNTRSLANRYLVPFHFMVDVDNRAAKMLDILNVAGTPLGVGVLGYEEDTVLPTVIMTNASGEIIYADLTDNYRIRPEPDVFIEIMRDKGGIAV